MPGDSQSQRTQALFGDIMQYYEIVRVENRLQTLHPNDFTSSGIGKANKLTCKAAVARDLVPLIPYLAKSFLTSGSVHDATVCTVAENLAACYRLHDSPGKDLQRACKRFANAYAALEASADPGTAHWRIKPKLHLFQELCEYSPRAPRLFWCYRDENFGNLCATLFQRRGGVDTQAKMARRFCCGGAAKRLFRTLSKVPRRATGILRKVHQT